MAFRAPQPGAFRWNSRLLLKFLDDDYWWNAGLIYNRPHGGVIPIPPHDNLIMAPVREDITLDPRTQFQSIDQMLPFIDTLQSLSGTAGAIAGKALGGVAKYTQIDLWKSTEPLTFSLTLHFDTDISSYSDVWMPAMALLCYTVPEETADNILKVPGTNILATVEGLLGKGANVNSTIKSKTSKDGLEGYTLGAVDRTISLLVGGWLYFYDALLIKAVPTFSKHLTESGYPLWADVSCEFKTKSTTTVDLLLGMTADSYIEGGALGAVSRAMTVIPDTTNGI